MAQFLKIIDELEAKAKAAPTVVFDSETESGRFYNACSPDTVLTLITALREACEVIEFYANYKNWLLEADSDIARRISAPDCSAVERYAEFCGGRKAREFREKWGATSNREQNHTGLQNDVL